MTHLSFSSAVVAIASPLLVLSFYPAPAGENTAVPAPSSLQQAAAAPAAQGAPNTLTPDEIQAGWKLLFDGKTTAGWRGYKMTTMPPEWMAMDGTLMKSRRTEDIVTVQIFSDFELSFEWRVAPAGNAGVFYRGTEEYNRVYWSTPEYQLADDALTPDSRNPLTSAGSVYGFYPSTKGVAKAANEWNVGKIVARGKHVEHWLNGVKLAEFEFWSPDFEAKYQASKFRPYPNFGRAASGFIAIQGDHNGELSLRNIKIRELK